MTEQIVFAVWHKVKVFQCSPSVSFVGKPAEEITSQQQDNTILPKVVTQDHIQAFLFKYLSVSDTDFVHRFEMWACLLPTEMKTE